MPKETQEQKNYDIVIKDVAVNFLDLSKDFKVCDYNDNSFNKSFMMCVSQSDLLTKVATGDKTSQAYKDLYNAYKTARCNGLSLNPFEGKAAIVAYEYDGKISINYMLMKNGLIDLAFQTKQFKVLTSDVVHEKDYFKITKTLTGDNFEHIPSQDISRGDIIKYYAGCVLVNGVSKVVDMTVEEVEKHKNKYGKGLNKTKSAWNTSFDGMAIKTVIKKLLNSVHVDSSFIDSYEESDQYLEPIKNKTNAEKTLDKVKSANKMDSPANAVDVKELIDL